MHPTPGRSLMLALSQLLLLIPTGVEGLSASNGCGRWPARAGGSESFVMLTCQADHATAGRAQILKQNGLQRRFSSAAERLDLQAGAWRCGAACGALRFRRCIDRERTTERLCMPQFALRTVTRQTRRTGAQTRRHHSRRIARNSSLSTRPEARAGAFLPRSLSSRYRRAAWGPTGSAYHGVRR